MPCNLAFEFQWFARSLHELEGAEGVQRKAERVPVLLQQVLEVNVLLLYVLRCPQLFCNENSFNYAGLSLLFVLLNICSISSLFSTVFSF